MEVSYCLLIALAVGIVVFLLTAMLLARHLAGFTFIFALLLIALGAILALKFGDIFTKTKVHTETQKTSTETTRPSTPESTPPTPETSGVF